jgi:hypothetical protein
MLFPPPRFCFIMHLLKLKLVRVISVIFNIMYLPRIIFNDDNWFNDIKTIIVINVLIYINNL